MTTLLAVLDFKDLTIGAALGAVIGWLSGAATHGNADLDVRRLMFQLRELQNKVDALLKHFDIEMPTSPPSDLSPEVQFLAREPGQMIAAIRLYREEHPGVGLAAAKARIEEFKKIRH